MELLKKVDFAVLEDAVKKLKFVKHIASEKDKNHGEGTVPALNGCIPFINFGSFNPGRFFEKYLNALPDNSTKPGIEGGFLFMKPRGNSKKWSMHSPDSKVLFEENVKGESFLETVYFIVLSYPADLTIQRLNSLQVLLQTALDNSRLIVTKKVNCG